MYFGGSSPAAHDLAAEQVETYLTWGEPPAEVAKKVADVRARASKLGRTVKFGIRLHVIVRETDEQAWAAAEELISHVSDDTVVRGEDADGGPIYAYVGVRADKLQSFMEAQNTGMFYPEEHGVVIEAGVGEPSAEIRATSTTPLGVNVRPPSTRVWVSCVHHA